MNSERISRYCVLYPNASTMILLMRCSYLTLWDERTKRSQDHHNPDPSSEFNPCESSRKEHDRVQDSKQDGRWHRGIV